MPGIPLIFSMPAAMTSDRFLPSRAAKSAVICSSLASPPPAVTTYDGDRVSTSARHGSRVCPRPRARPSRGSPVHLPPPSVSSVSRSIPRLRRIAARRPNPRLMPLRKPAGRKRASTCADAVSHGLDLIRGRRGVAAEDQKRVSSDVLHPFKLSELLLAIRKIKSGGRRSKSISEAGCCPDMSLHGTQKGKPV